MNLKRFLLLSIATYGICALWALTGVQGSSETPKTVPVPSTVTVGMLTPQQQQERIQELSTTTTSTSTTTTTTTTIPPITVAPVPADTHCQEWFPLAISVGWPNDPAILEKLGQILFKETRCQNIIKGDPRWNGHDWGPAQINDTAHHDYVEQVFGMPFEEAMSDPAKNLQYAYLLYSEREAVGKCGWKPWSLC